MSSATSQDEINIIPLSSGYAFQRFRVQLGNHYLVFRLRWLTLHRYFCVDIYESGEPVTLGRALLPGINLLDGLNTRIGKIILRGEEPTPENLGIDNQLQWVEHE